MQEKTNIKKNWIFSVAPMMNWTTPECRKIHRLFNKNAMLYTEMVTTGAILYGDKKRHLAHQDDMPCALQLGGGNPNELAQSVRIANEYHYSEINLNVGCPSDRVQNNEIGACLMSNPKKVADCLNAMQNETDLPVTIKHRLAIDDLDEKYVFDFVDYLYHHSSCKFFIIHARKALLQGLNPKENRQIPPLKYDLVYQIKKNFPDCIVSINGGINNFEEIKQHLNHVDGVMLGRAAYQNPLLIAQSNCLFDDEIPDTEILLSKIEQLLYRAQENGEILWEYYRHLLGLFQGQYGAKNYRRILSEHGRSKQSTIKVWQEAIHQIRI